MVEYNRIVLSLFWHIYSEIDHKMCTTRFEIKSFHLVCFVSFPFPYPFRAFDSNRTWTRNRYRNLKLKLKLKPKLRAGHKSLWRSRLLNDFYNTWISFFSQFLWRGKNLMGFSIVFVICKGFNGFRSFFVILFFRFIYNNINETIKRERCAESVLKMD